MNVLRGTDVERGVWRPKSEHISIPKGWKRLLAKLSGFFGVQFTKPDFRPVYINKRLKKYSGIFYGGHIDIAYNCYDKKDILWHELLHAVVSDNWEKVGKEWKFRGMVVKAVFQLEGRGNHKSRQYQLKCDCGYWVKSVKRKYKTFCKYCKTWLVSQTEYNKLKKIAQVKSSIVNVEIDNYKPWKENKKIGLNIK